MVSRATVHIPKGSILRVLAYYRGTHEPGRLDTPQAASFCSY